MEDSSGLDPALLKIWGERLENLTVSPLTRDYPEPSQSTGKRPVDAFESLSSSEDVSHSIKLLAKGSISNFNVIQAAFIVLVSRLTGDEDISIGTNQTQGGRPFVLRTPLTFSTKFSDLLSKTSEVATLAPVSE